MPRHRNCEGMTRRDTLELGLRGVIAGGLVGALRTVASAADSAESRTPQAKACILIWMDGGPSHYETFDPKPEAPREIRGEYDAIPTKLKGVYFSQHMERLASIADKVSVIRSIRHNQGNHGAGNHYMMTGSPPRIPVGCGAYVSFHPSMGSVIASELGAPEGLPPYFSMPSMTRSGGPNFLGGKFAPFVVSSNPNAADFRVRDVALPKGLTEQGFERRQAVRKQVDTMLRLNDKAAGDPVLALDEFYQYGTLLMSSKQAQEAFDIGRESELVRNRYGRDGFGQRALLARRLVQAGVPFVTLNEGGWDHHRDLFKTCDKRLPEFENTLATLIEDLDDRGMLQSTMVIAMGEFGRTPQINKDGGRDHWSNAMSVLFAGGKSPRGQVIGATDRQGYSAVDRVLSPESLVATVYTKLGIDPNKVVYTPEGRPAHLVADATPIKELL